ncbi:hypothetical protein QWY93_05520 [Echinicola jeungdonensis]|uniref:Uncharacterized protein n=1 Tax=Echinicola jeungdonensis TaxID=709343 RepID=A0ABV5J2G8_9BACT|nr:hypothetical protein [Echinicola jeungdonensis]MDN3668783.1 hypothetical protein [Echinicola jeungdonensis]
MSLKKIELKNKDQNLLKSSFSRLKLTMWLFRSDHASDFGQTVPLRKII